jgi:hypothetical protein
MFNTIDRKFRVPRVWSNRELRRFSAMFEGAVANVSGWRDEDKEGGKYREYFSKASEYWITNYKSEARGFQGGVENELFLDLTQDLPQDLHGRFDVVFNHTVLEHIFDVRVAFANLCRMTKDIAIVVVPFIQEQHGDYGDYWRFTPQAMDLLFVANGMETIYCSVNDARSDSIYVFAIGSKNSDKWGVIRQSAGNLVDQVHGGLVIGTKIIRNSLSFRVANALRRILRKRDRFWP